MPTNRQCKLEWTYFSGSVNLNFFRAALLYYFKYSLSGFQALPIIKHFSYFSFSVISLCYFRVIKIIFLFRDITSLFLGCQNYFSGYQFAIFGISKSFFGLSVCYFWDIKIFFRDITLLFLGYQFWVVEIQFLGYQNSFFGLSFSFFGLSKICLSVIALNI